MKYSQKQLQDLVAGAFQCSPNEPAFYGSGNGTFLNTRQYAKLDEKAKADYMEFKNPRFASEDEDAKAAKAEAAAQKKAEAEAKAAEAVAKKKAEAEAKAAESAKRKSDAEAKAAAKATTSKGKQDKA